MNTLPVAIGFAVGCALGAAAEAAIGLWSLMLPTALALFACVIARRDARRCPAIRSIGDINMGDTRIETDSMGTVAVPADRLWGAQTQRSLEHFSIGHDLMPREMITAYAILKRCAATANHAGGRLDDADLRADNASLRRNPRRPAPRHVPSARLDDRQRHPVQHERQRGHLQPLLPARRHAAWQQAPVHPNDHVNMSQSSNDSFPSAMHIAAAFGLRLWAWAGTYAALVCQTQLGASSRKGWFRMMGTVIGTVVISYAENNNSTKNPVEAQR